MMYPFVIALILIRVIIVQPVDVTFIDINGISSKGIECKDSNNKRLVNDNDLNEFGLNSSKLMDMTHRIFSYWSEEVYLKGPTPPHGNMYWKHNWQEVYRTITWVCKSVSYEEEILETMFDVQPNKSEKYTLYSEINSKWKDIDVKHPGIAFFVTVNSGQFKLNLNTYLGDVPKMYTRYDTFSPECTFPAKLVVKKRTINILYEYTSKIEGQVAVAFRRKISPPRFPTLMRCLGCSRKYFFYSYSIADGMGIYNLPNFITNNVVLEGTIHYDAKWVTTSVSDFCKLKPLNKYCKNSTTEVTTETTKNVTSSTSDSS